MHRVGPELTPTSTRQTRARRNLFASGLFAFSLAVPREVAGGREPVPEVLPTAVFLGERDAMKSRLSDFRSKPSSGHPFGFLDGQNAWNAPCSGLHALEIHCSVIDKAELCIDGGIFDANFGEAGGYSVCTGAQPVIPHCLYARRPRRTRMERMIRRALHAPDARQADHLDGSCGEDDISLARS